MSILNSSRREFLKTSTLAIGASTLLNPFYLYAYPVKEWTVGEIMKLFISQVPDAPFENTVDTLKSGSREQIVTGIVTTMFATITVIRKAIDLKANLIIAHEPTFYNHLDETEWLKNDPVYRFKADLLKKHGIAVWRNHDYVHSLEIDGVQAGVVDELGWNAYYKQNAVLEIPTTSLIDLISHIKIKMNIPALRFVGNLDQSISKVLLLPGAMGGRRQIEITIKEKPDVIIVDQSEYLGSKFF